MAYVKKRWTVEHSWFCSACKTQVQGRHLTCPKCGKPKSDENYDERNATRLPAVTDPKLIAIASGGPNWDCAFCRFENRNRAAVCAQCGAASRTVNDIRAAVGFAPIAMSNAVYPAIPKIVPGARESIETQPGVHAVSSSTSIFAPGPGDKRTATPSAGGYRDAPVKRIDEEAVPSPPTETPKPRRSRFDPGANRAAVLVLACAGSIAAFIALFVWLLTPWHEHVHIVGATWARWCELQHRETRHDQDWGSPPGAFNISCVSRQHGTHECNPYDCRPHDVDCRCHQVADGESCDTQCSSGGNGFSDCEEVCETEYTTECDTCTEYDTCYEQCPTYDDWCDYDYYAWPAVAHAAAAGTDRDEVIWPAVPATDLNSGMYRVVRDEEYHVTFSNQNGTWNAEPGSESDFHRFHTGAAWDIQVTHAGAVTPIHEEHP